MHRTVAVLVAGIIGFATPLAAFEKGADGASDVITIEVAPQDLDRCRATLAQVLAPPVDPADAMQVDAPALPKAVCVVSEV